MDITDPTQVKANPFERPDTSTADGNPELGKNEFVKLLMAQLSNQDPTAPQDSAAFVAQLAQFATVELQQQQTGQLEGLLVGQAAANQTSATNLVGKDVLYATDSISWKGGDATDVVVDLQSNASQITVVIEDENGNVVRKETLPGHAQGRMSYEWDGMTDRGEPAKEGNYKIRVAASDTDGRNVDLIQSVRGRVDGISFADGSPVLLIGDDRLKMADVVEILAPQTSDPTTTTTSPDRAVTALMSDFYLRP